MCVGKVLVALVPSQYFFKIIVSCISLTHLILPRLAAYTYDIEYRASKNHRNADALCLTCRRKPRKKLTNDWKREIKSIEFKLNVHSLQQPKSERLQEGMQFFLVFCILYCMVGQQKRTHRKSSDFIVRNEKNLHLLKSRKFNPIVQRGFEVGEPVRFVIVDRLGLRVLFKIDWSRCASWKVSLEKTYWSITWTSWFISSWCWAQNLRLNGDRFAWKARWKCACFNARPNFSTICTEWEVYHALS